jgi:hypothetical protein
LNRRDVIDQSQKCVLRHPNETFNPTVKLGFPLSGSVQPFFGFAWLCISAHHGGEMLCVFLGLMCV